MRRHYASGSEANVPKFVGSVIEANQPAVSGGQALTYDPVGDGNRGAAKYESSEFAVTAGTAESLSLYS